VTDTRRPSTSRLLVATVSGIVVVWLALFVDLASQTRWLDVVLLVVVSALVVGAYLVQRASRPFTG
jgi:hypothetical protein